MGRSEYMTHIVVTAFFAGIISVLTPCVLPLVPVVMAGSVGEKFRPIAIVVGMSLTFSLMGVVTSMIGGTLAVYLMFLRTIGVFLIILLGVMLVSKELYEKFLIYSSGVLTKLKPVKVKTSGPFGIISGLILGLSLGLVWVPCVGPILGSVLVLVAIQGNVFTGGLALFSYSLGIGIPMLIVAYTGKFASEKISGVAKYSGTIKTIAGIILILAGISMLFGLDRRVQVLLYPYFPDVILH